ncbi:hypothetical protein EC912_106161 [Luteibacter rhizovicinus]|uniref:Uncharacterized protein n=1 Tax=Luteibacter rhizovicinus TaxID=242606 RepID=A0A4R3YKZ7_9GAMM|nr:hypothetical protein [Luteibacter rhizovicinus]TCV92822.1 hypothetical protein EC912_106161 [Luteibacter rhizovicinus]
MTLLACAMAFVAVTLVYLTLPSQRLLKRGLGRGMRLVGVALSIGAVALWASVERGLPGFFATLTAAMLGAIALPYLAWWLRPGAARQRERT